MCKELSAECPNNLIFQENIFHIPLKCICHSDLSFSHRIIELCGGLVIICCHMHQIVTD